MRLIVVADPSSPWSVELIRSLRRERWEITVIGLISRTSSAKNNPLWVAGTTVFRDSGVAFVPVRRRNLVMNAIALARAIRRASRDTRAEAVICLYGGLFSLAAYLSGARPYGVYFVGSDVLLMTGFRRLLARFFGRAARILLANGETLALRAGELMSRNDVIPLYLGIDTQRFAPAPRLQNAPVHIVCTRWFEPIYDNTAIIKALSRLPKNLPEWRMTFASSGALLEESKLLAAKLLAPEDLHRVVFAGGMNSEEIRNLVVSSDVYVSMSLSDGTSTSLLEALAAGVFPVVSDISGSQEWVDRNDRGMLIPVGDDVALSNALAHAILSPELRAAAARLNRTRVLERADAATNTQRLSDLLKSMAARDKQRVCADAD